MGKNRQVRGPRDLSNFRDCEHEAGVERHVDIYIYSTYDIYIYKYIYMSYNIHIVSYTDPGVNNGVKKTHMLFMILIWNFHLTPIILYQHFNNQQTWILSRCTLQRICPIFPGDVFQLRVFTGI